MNNYKINNNVVFVTGAAGQLGQAVVNSLLKSGAKVICSDISIENLEKAANKNSWDDSVMLIQVDITNENNVSSAFHSGLKKFGRVDSLVNNAGISVFKPWYERSDQEFDSVMNVNIKGTFLCMKEFFKYSMKSGNQGSVVNIASHYGIISPDPRIYTDCNRRNSEVYGASKAGLIQMTKYFSVNAIADGANVRVNCIAPGGILNEENPQGKDFQKLYAERCPMKRMANVQEMVGPILFLLSPDSSYINGHTIVIDGGMSSW
jgi:NAD(P)-dependent dehydrogenase (short-subunit alcohol dehydrogenase family)